MTTTSLLRRSLLALAAVVLAARPVHGASSCLELQEAGTTKDGEYMLAVGGGDTEVSVYCYHMDIDGKPKACTSGQPSRTLQTGRQPSLLPVGAAFQLGLLRYSCRCFACVV